MGHSTLLGLVDTCLGVPDAKWGIRPGAYGWYMAVLLDTPDVTEPLGSVARGSVAHHQ